MYFRLHIASADLLVAKGALRLDVVAVVGWRRLDLAVQIMACQAIVLGIEPV